MNSKLTLGNDRKFMATTASCFNLKIRIIQCCRHLHQVLAALPISADDIRTYQVDIHQGSPRFKAYDLINDINTRAISEDELRTWHEQ